jgi:hypothetical protein
VCSSDLRLRSQASSLARRLSSDDHPVANLKIKVRADWSVADRPEKKPLGKTALSALDAFEETLPEGGLKAALARMLERQRS